jgi:hypothetical protein
MNINNDITTNPYSGDQGSTIGQTDQRNGINTFNVDGLEFEIVEMVNEFVNTNQDTILNKEPLSTFGKIQQKLNALVTHIKKQTPGIGYLSYLFSGDKARLLDPRNVMQILNFLQMRSMQPRLMAPSEAIVANIPFEPQMNEAQAHQKVAAEIPLPPPPPSIEGMPPPPPPPSGGMPPPPPPGPGKGGPLGKGGIAQKNFANEPMSPKIALPIKMELLSHLSQEEMEKQILQIEEFIQSMKEVLAPIENAIQEEADLKEDLETAILKQKTIKQEIAENKAKICLLQTEGPSCTLKLHTKKDEYISIPYFSDARWKAINAALESKGADPLPRTYLKSEELKIAEQKLEELKPEKIKQAQKVITLTQKRQAIQASQNNGITFDQYAKVLETKKNHLASWERAEKTLKTRHKQLTTPSTPKKAIAAPSAQTKIKKPSLTQLIPELAKQFPELKDFQALSENQNALILLQGDEYHDFLIAN